MLVVVLAYRHQLSYHIAGVVVASVVAMLGLQVSTVVLVVYVYNEWSNIVCTLSTPQNRGYWFMKQFPIIWMTQCGDVDETWQLGEIPEISDNEARRRSKGNHTEGTRQTMIVINS